MSARLWIYPLLLTLLFVLYFSTAQLGLNIHAVNSFATLVWIPSGLALAFLFRFGLKYWPAVALGAFTANLVNDAPLSAALGISIGNTLEPVAGAILLRRIVNLQPTFDRISDVLGLVFFAALFSTLISATIGVTSLWLSNVIGMTDYSATWFAWWSGDAISVMIIAPLLLVWSTRPSAETTQRYFFELAALVAASLLVFFAIFGEVIFQFTDNQPRSYLVFPVLIWAALRFGQRATVSIIFLLSVVATASTALNVGPFSTNIASEDLQNLQMYMAVTGTTAMILAAAISEQKIFERKKDEFISVASHELKTPITSIKAFTQTMQMLFEKKGDRESSAHMGRMNRQIDRLNRLVVKLLDLTRIQEGRITLQKERFNVGSLIREIADEISGTTHHKIIISGDTRARIVADRDRIGRVLTNLLTNAAKYSPEADKILIKVTKKDGKLSIAIRDYGIGINKADRERVFDRFYQTPRKKSDHLGDSLGLGLFIAKSIVEKHDGRIWLKSNRPGSTFCFELPLKSPKA